MSISSNGIIDKDRLFIALGRRLPAMTCQQIEDVCDAVTGMINEGVSPWLPAAAEAVAQPAVEAKRGKDHLPDATKMVEPSLAEKIANAKVGDTVVEKHGTWIIDSVNPDINGECPVSGNRDRGWITRNYITDILPASEAAK